MTIFWKVEPPISEYYIIKRARRDDHTFTTPPPHHNTTTPPQLLVQSSSVLWNCSALEPEPHRGCSQWHLFHESAIHSSQPVSLYPVELMIGPVFHVQISSSLNAGYSHQNDMTKGDTGWKLALHTLIGGQVPQTQFSGLTDAFVTERAAALSSIPASQEGPNLWTAPWRGVGPLCASSKDRIGCGLGRSGCDVNRVGRAVCTGQTTTTVRFSVLVRKSLCL